MPFGRVGAREFGTYFIGYARTRLVIEQMLTNMFVGDPPGNYDRMLDFSTAVTGGLFFVPTVELPRGLAVRSDRRRRGRGQGRGRTRRRAIARADTSTRLWSERWVARPRRPSGGPEMNHLLRAHAPISEMGWEQIDQEARERLEPALAARRLVDFSGPLGWEHSATSVGRASALPGAPAGEVSGMRREVLPLVELRADFVVSRAELSEHRSWCARHRLRGARRRCAPDRDRRERDRAAMAGPRRSEESRSSPRTSGAHSVALRRATHR